MKHVKLFEQFINDELNEGTMNASQLADYVWTNWKKITGLKDSDRDQEGDFPEEVNDLMKKHKVDYVEFSDAWTDLGDLRS